MVKWFRLRPILGVGLPKSIDFCCGLRREYWQNFVTLSNGFRLLGKFNRGLRLAF